MKRSPALALDRVVFAGDSAVIEATSRMSAAAVDVRSDIAAADAVNFVVAFAAAVAGVVSVGVEYFVALAEKEGPVSAVAAISLVERIRQDGCPLLEDILGQSMDNTSSS